MVIFREGGPPVFILRGGQKGFREPLRSHLCEKNPLYGYFFEGRSCCSIRMVGTKQSQHVIQGLVGSSSGFRGPTEVAREGVLAVGGARQPGVGLARSMK